MTFFLMMQSYQRHEAGAIPIVANAINIVSGDERHEMQQPS